jgi:hypothetical protein
MYCCRLIAPVRPYISLLLLLLLLLLSFHL